MSDSTSSNPLSELLKTISPGVVADAERLAAEIALLREQVKVLEAKLTPKWVHPPKSEAEKLVDLANSLPQEVLGDAATAGSFRAMNHIAFPIEFTKGVLMRWHSVSEVEHILLGVMSKYVGSEKYAYVWSVDGGKVYWQSGWNSSPPCSDLLTAHRDCCLAIHARRKEAGR